MGQPRHWYILGIFTDGRPQVAWGKERAEPKLDDITHRCTISDRQYVVSRKAALSAEVEGRLGVYESTDGGTTWHDLPMTLTWSARIAHGLFVTWPPEKIDRLVCEGDQVVLEFRDPWVPYEKPIMPWGLDRESLWQASYLKRVARWRLKRIRRLDYEGADAP